MDGVITKEHLAVLRELRELGCAVVVFEPAELRGTSPGRLEDWMIERGWDMIAEQPEDE